jgi:ornithine carbamoyltransferase
MEHFISIADWSPSDLQGLLDLALKLKQGWMAGGNRPVLQGKTLAMVFQKPSLRTRVSFDMAMRHLGGDALYLSPQEIGLGGRESVADVARVLSRYVEGIMARVFKHEHIVELARYSRVPVINGLSDYSHPCQAMADFLTIYEKFGPVKGLRLTFVGDGNNVAVSLAFLAAKLGAHFTLASPAGYDLPEAVVALVRELDAASGGTLTLLRDPLEAVRDAHVVYTDVWTSMGQEAENEARQKVFPPYQVNARLMSHARADAIFMHCLPAHRGAEVTDEVADSPQSMIFDQAENRMHAQKAVLVRLLARDHA